MDALTVQNKKIYFIKDSTYWCLPYVTFFTIRCANVRRAAFVFDKKPILTISFALSPIQRN